MRFEYISMKELDRTSVPFCWCHNHHVLDNPFADTPKYHIVELSPKYHIVELSLSSCFPGYCKSQLLTFPHYLPWYLMTSIISRLSPNRIHSNIQYIHHLSNYINIKKKKKSSSKSFYKSIMSSSSFLVFWWLSSRSPRSPRFFSAGSPSHSPELRPLAGPGRWRRHPGREGSYP